MPISPVVPGMPGLRAAQTATPRLVFKTGPQILPGGKMIDGVNSRDPLNTGNLNVLQPGVLMGKITSTSLYAPSILGTVSVAYNGGTSLTVGAATAVELNRRVGGSGTFKLVGPSVASGPIQIIVVTYSAINTTTGVITVTDPLLTFIIGSFVCPTDGSENIITCVPDMDSFTGILVTDTDGVTNLTVPFPQVPIGGLIQSSQIINWPTDTSLQAYIRQSLRNASGSQFQFDDQF